MLGTTDRTTAILGLTNKRSLMEAVRAGLPVSSFASVVAYTRLTQEALAGAANISLRTVQRRLKESRSARFALDESDRLARVARMYAYAESILGSRERAESWMKTPNWALDGTLPLALLDTEISAREVEDALGRIDDGTFA
ncbi:MAG: hypothetical protein NVS3B28_30470 [Candidatus Velthaea sp.]